MIKIDVAADFSRTPGPRYRSEGSWSGQQFREDFLEGPIGKGESLEIDLDGPVGFTTSFLEEAFGGLVRHFGARVASLLTFVAETKPHRIAKAQYYVLRAVKVSQRGGR